jgi:hypothetical protein
MAWAAAPRPGRFLVAPEPERDDQGARQGGCYDGPSQDGLPEAAGAGVHLNQHGGDPGGKRTATRRKGMSILTARCAEAETQGIGGRSTRKARCGTANPSPDGGLQARDRPLAPQNTVQVPSAHRTKHTSPFHNSHPPSNGCMAPWKRVLSERDSPRHAPAQGGTLAGRAVRWPQNRGRTVARRDVDRERMDKTRDRPMAVLWTIVD